MSVDTNVKGKNLAPYRRVTHDDLRILVAPQLAGMVTSMRIAVRGRLVKSLRVSLDGPTDQCSL
ncbi:MAG: hypothetical protein KDB21_02045 [Acidimicrobiales bacterium]|nr:hypothetical protein [Acidimicrobiales bacterium]